MNRHLEVLSFWRIILSWNLSSWTLPSTTVSKLSISLHKCKRILIPSIQNYSQLELKAWTMDNSSQPFSSPMKPSSPEGFNMLSLLRVLERLSGIPNSCSISCTNKCASPISHSSVSTRILPLESCILPMLFWELFCAPSTVMLISSWDLPTVSNFKNCSK